MKKMLLLFTLFSTLNSGIFFDDFNSNLPLKINPEEMITLPSKEDILENALKLGFPCLDDEEVLATLLYFSGETLKYGQFKKDIYFVWDHLKQLLNQKIENIDPFTMNKHLNTFLNNYLNIFAQNCSNEIQYCKAESELYEKLYLRRILYTTEELNQRVKEIQLTMPKKKRIDIVAVDSCLIENSPPRRRLTICGFGEFYD